MKGIARGGENITFAGVELYPIRIPLDRASSYRSPRTPFVCPVLSLSDGLFLCVSVCLCVCVSVCLCVSLSVCLFLFVCLYELGL